MNRHLEDGPGPSMLAAASDVALPANDVAVLATPKPQVGLDQDMHLVGMCMYLVLSLGIL